MDDSADKDNHHHFLALQPPGYWRYALNGSISLLTDAPALTAGDWQPLTWPLGRLTAITA
jgi:hypothetical protein